jgi:hypothetical protein
MLQDGAGSELRTYPTLEELILKCKKLAYFFPHFAKGDLLASAAEVAPM